MYKKSMHLFVEHYEMEEVMQEETLMRAFQRWRKLADKWCAAEETVRPFFRIFRKRGKPHK